MRHSVSYLGEQFTNELIRENYTIQYRLWVFNFDFLNLLPPALLQFSVRAYDIGTPSRQSAQFATVRVNIVRNANCPQFTNLPGSVEISQTTGLNTNIFNVSARDLDPPVSH